MMVPHPNEGPLPYKYGSVDDSEQPASYSSLLPRSSRCSYPAVGQEHLPQHKNKGLRDPKAGSGVSRRLAVAVLCGLAFLAGCGVSLKRSTSQSTAAASGFFEVGADADFAGAGAGASEIRPADSSSSAAFVSPLEFTALNFYHVRDGKPGQDYPWLKDVKLIEPYRDTTLAVVGAREGFVYRWEVRSPGSSMSSSGGGGGLGEVQATATGAVTIVVLTQLHEHVVVLEEVDGDGRVTNRLEETVLVKYVRREIRTLTDDEREELLDAMFQLWEVRVDDGDGVEIYGEDYVDAYAINRIHFLGTTNDTCDHFHEGIGFLASHSLITNTFEFSLQLVNPKLTLPYWDFTIETTSASSVTFNPAEPYTRTELLSPSWFGTGDLKDHMVKDGRWAYTAIPKDRKNNPGKIETDIYGKLRSPWNVNDRPYLSRGLGQACQISDEEYMEWPSCGTHFNVTTTNPSFYSWVWDSMGNPHGPVHVWLGGTLDCGYLYKTLSNLVGNDIAEVFAYLGLGHRKKLWYSGIWTCDEGEKASVDVKPFEILSSGTCGCRGYDLTQGDDYKTLIPYIGFFDYYIGGFSGEIQRQVVELLCSGVVNLGDMVQSSSTLDPMFWATHPTMERLWQFSVVTGQVTEFNWPDGNINVTLPDGSIYTEYVSGYYESCRGHHGSDIFPYGVMDLDTDSFEIKTGIKSNPVKGNNLSNREVLAALDPRSNSLNYVYDTFKWDHCVSEGYDFDDAWGETSPSPVKTFFAGDDFFPAMYASFERKMAELMKEEGDAVAEKERKASSRYT